MKAKILVIIITGAVFVLFTSVTYIHIKKYRANKEATQLYNAGLKRIFSKDNAFCPDAQLAFYDSLELLSSFSQRQAMVIQFYKSVTLLKMGQEKKAIEILSVLVERTVYLDVNSGGSFGGNSLRKEIGIGKAQQIDELEIRWPASGTVQLFKNVQPRQFLRITEGKDQPEKLNLACLEFRKRTKALIDCMPVAGKVARK